MKNETYIKLKSWRLENMYGHVMYFSGIRCGDERKYLYLSILRAEKNDEGFIVYTTDGTFLLPFDGIEDNQTIPSDLADKIESQYQKINKAAERFLSEGDCMMCDRVLRYRSENGIVEIYPAGTNQHRELIYSYPEEEFELAVSDEIFFSVKCRSKYKNGCIYNVRLPDSVWRIDYRCIDLRRCVF